jgi:hypothetical protein
MLYPMVGRNSWKRAAKVKAVERTTLAAPWARGTFPTERGDAPGRREHIGLGSGKGTRG